MAAVRWRAIGMVGVLGLASAGLVLFLRDSGAVGGPDRAVGVAASAAAPPARSPASAGDTGSVRYERLAGPDRTVVRDASGATVATLTDGARTAVLAGPSRTFGEAKFTTATVTTVAWVRLLPEPWTAGAETGPWFAGWFDTAVADRGPDVLAVAAQYTDGAPPVRNGEGVRIGGDASFGPVAASGAGRLERSDFYDYLGAPYAFPDGSTGRPDPQRYGAADCSGFVRLVYGYRLGYPLLNGNAAGPGIPRRAYAIAEAGPGVRLVANSGSRSTAYDALQPGDLVFFEVEDGEDQLDHAAIYFGVDDTGHHRFISSRERADGPTFGDLGGTSLLDDGGHYSRSWRAARRL